ncbi:hypothetical protein RFI_29703 [Reticulomyxa filosa]|uniref:Uncharacterized protein n=1 Tax=Reticulomyxa filosa TaxID=46433 RepID=X6M0H5_RETFI|nr:hypothetical protein RFI_29703 [Reticulomyxa filosa]|eukprot:ETO07688.1 hypothetical protein RFI_29703 [Reticulomyxa filosa]
MQFEWDKANEQYSSNAVMSMPVNILKDVSPLVRFPCAFHCLNFARILKHKHLPLKNSRLFLLRKTLLQGMNKTYWLKVISNVGRVLPLYKVLPKSSSKASCLGETPQRPRYWFPVLDRTYTYEMKYVLNIRSVKHWIMSKSDAFEHKYLLSQLGICKFQKMANSSMMAMQMVHFQWYWQWYQYICSILHYFGTDRLNRDVVVFDVENDSPDKLVDFFRPLGLSLDASLFGHSHWSHKKIKKKFTGKRSQEQFYQKTVLPMILTHPNEYVQIRTICEIDVF